MSDIKRKNQRKGSIGRKMILYISLTSFIVFGSAFFYIALKSQKMAVDNAHELAKTYADVYANFVQDKLNADMHMAISFGQSLYSYHKIPVVQRMEIYKDMMFDLIENNPQFEAVWINWERSTFDSAWNLPYGRGRFTVYKQEDGTFHYRIEYLDEDGDNPNGDYFKMKQSKVKTIVNPYSFSYSGRQEEAILETSLCMPIIYNDNFSGLAGMDISLAKYQEIINQIEPIKGSRVFLLANNSTFVTHHDEELVGSNFKNTYPEIEEEFNISGFISEGDHLQFKVHETNNYYTLSPVLIADTDTPWAILVIIPLDSILEEARSSFTISILVGLAGLIILLVIVWYISKSITRPIKRTTRVLKKLDKGDLENITEIKATSNDEIKEMADSLNKLMKGLRHTAEFADSIGQGNLDSEYNLLSDKDALGHALLNMQKSLIEARKEEEKRKEEDKKQRWTTEGLASFGAILRQNNDNLDRMSFNIIKNLVDYTGANQGSIFVRSNSEEESYELKAAVAFDRRKNIKKSFKPGESLVGRVVHEKLTIYMTDVPDDYVHLTSGLGEANPRAILLVPLVLNEEVFGALELVSFIEFEEYKISFVEKIGESIASTISNVKVTERTNRLLEESQLQQDELTSQEEEMRQNLEELKATQEEAARRENEMNELIDSLGASVLITELDLDGKIININKKSMDLLGVAPDKLINKHHKSLGLDNNSTPDQYKIFWQNLKKGRKKKRISQVSTPKSKKYIEENYIPIKDNEGQIVKIVAIGYDFTRVKEKELEIEELKDKLNH